jgi:hypothetical protein
MSSVFIVQTPLAIANSRQMAVSRSNLNSRERKVSPGRSVTIEVADDVSGLTGFGQAIRRIRSTQTRAETVTSSTQSTWVGMRGTHFVGVGMSKINGVYEVI